MQNVNIFFQLVTFLSLTYCVLVYQSLHLKNLKTKIEIRYRVQLLEVTQYFSVLLGSRFSTQFEIRHGVDFKDKIRNLF